MRRASPEINIPVPDLQIDFSACLAAARNAYLLDALLALVGQLEIAALDAQFAGLVPNRFLQVVAEAGLRAELVFPAPMILDRAPRLLAYYRLLLGHSQKAFYQGRNGTAAFQCMEKVGTSPKTANTSDLCKALIKSLCVLVEGVGAKRLNRELLDDLTLLTLGPQLRGGANVKKGVVSTLAVFELIHSIVQGSLTSATDQQLVLKNAAGRTMVIQFASDPDIVILDAMGPNAFREVVAIEVKGGTDFSNIHNRIGEAEKSHQKARQAGHTECWTIVNVPNLNEAMARRESPSTNRFFRLSELLIPTSLEHTDFRNRVLALTGLSEPKRVKRSTK